MYIYTYICLNIYKYTYISICYVYDTYTHICPFSQWFKKELETRLFLHPAFGYDIKAAISDSVALIERDILDDPTIDTNFSGTTLVLTVIRGISVYIYVCVCKRIYLY
jgi:hypothetical protein